MEEVAAVQQGWTTPSRSKLLSYKTEQSDYIWFPFNNYWWSCGGSTNISLLAIWFTRKQNQIIYNLSCGGQQNMI